MSDSIKLIDGQPMSQSQFVGIAIARTLRERGLWREGDVHEDPALLIDRLRDMAALSNSAIIAIEQWNDLDFEGNEREGFIPGWAELVRRANLLRAPVPVTDDEPPIFDRMREIIREEIDEHAALQRIWEGFDPEKVRASLARDRRMIELLRTGVTADEAITTARAEGWL